MADAVIQLSGSVDRELVDIHYMFDIITNNDLTIDADITDNYVEDNTSRQDHMALKPLEYTLRGFVSEKVFYRRQEITDKIADGLSKLQPIAILAPTVSSYANTVIAASSYVEASVNRYIKNINSIKSLFNKNKTTQVTRQQQIAQDLIKIRDNRVLITLNSPFGFFENFLIKSAKIEQEETTTQSQIVVTVKEYRSVATKTVKIDAEKYAGRTASQNAIQENLGKVKGKEDLTSTLYRMTYGAVN
jgi:hypothetical protein